MHFVTCTVCHKSAGGLFQTKTMILNSMSYLHCTPNFRCLPPASLCDQPSWVGPCCASRCPSCSSALWCRPKAMVDTQNVLGSCTVSLAMGPGSLSPPEKKRTLNFKSTKASPLLAYAKGCQRTFTQERGRAGTQPSSCVLHLSQHRIKYL